MDGWMEGSFSPRKNKKMAQEARWGCRKQGRSRKGRRKEERLAPGLGWRRKQAFPPIPIPNARRNGDRQRIHLVRNWGSGLGEREEVTAAAIVAFPAASDLRFSINEIKHDARPARTAPRTLLPVPHYYSRSALLCVDSPPPRCLRSFRSHDPRRRACAPVRTR
jgi:hypothetical protein